MEQTLRILRQEFPNYLGKCQNLEDVYKVLKDLSQREGNVDDAEILLAMVCSAIQSAGIEISLNKIDRQINLLLSVVETLR